MREAKSAPASVSSRGVVQGGKSLNESDSSTCPYCGCELPPRRRAHCGKPECKRAYNNARGQQWNAEHPGYRSRYERKNVYSYERTCEQCGETFQTKHHDGRYCSRRCHALARRITGVALIPHPGPYSSLPAKHPAVLMQRTEYKRLFVAGRCARCGKDFVAHSEIGLARYCSRACQRQDGKDRRRALKRGVGQVTYKRIDIFERDGWRCHLCGRRVRRDVSTHHPLAPTIDHLVPLSRGGPDAPYNVACAHRRCNTLKNATGESQLLLIG